MKIQFQWIIALIIVSLLIIGASGCQKNSEQILAGKNIVIIQNFAFNPSEINVSVGEKITWINKDSYEHTVSLDDGLYNMGIKPGESISTMFDTAGTYTYHCSIHPSMKGKITVK